MNTQPTPTHQATQPRSWPNTDAWWLVGIAIAGFVFQGVRTIRNGQELLIDDAYISLRYAQNLVLGNGPVWQAGDRVEGYSD
jgi:hypothetical protein